MLDMSFFCTGLISLVARCVYVLRNMRIWFCSTGRKSNYNRGTYNNGAGLFLFKNSKFQKFKGKRIINFINKLSKVIPISGGMNYFVKTKIKAIKFIERSNEMCDHINGIDDMNCDNAIGKNPRCDIEMGFKFNYSPVKSLSPQLLDCIQSAPFAVSTNHLTNQQLSTNKVSIGYKGTMVEVFQGNVISGNGFALCNCPIEQDKLYFELEIIEPGKLFIGISRKLDYTELQNFYTEDLENIWGAVFGGVGNPAIETNDIISCLFNQSDYPPQIDFTLCGIPVPKLHFSDTRIKGELWIAIAVTDGARVKPCFEESTCKYFHDAYKSGFSCFIIGQRII